ncbi:MAG: SLBB domain-containing protein [Bacteroidota bacterium]
MRALLLAALAAAFLMPSVGAQIVPGGEFGRIDDRQTTPQGGYYINARPGEPTTRLSVWGQVLRPGVYEVGPGFGMGEVLALSGITEQQPREPGTPELYVRLIRGAEAGRAVVYDATLEAFARDAAPPPILDGDVIEVEPRPAVMVHVWGAVRTPGVYEVGPEYDAQAILSLAGGPLTTELRNNQSRERVVRIYKAGSAGDAPIYEQPLEVFVQGGAAVPTLEDGDVIEVESRNRDGWTARDSLTLAGVTASGVLALTQLLRLILE